MKPEFFRACKALEKQFAPDLIPNTTIESEFVDFFNDSYKDVRNMNESQFLKYILNVRSNIYPNFIRYIFKIIEVITDSLYRLCQILAVLPGSSVECERGFSNLNRIKGEDRNNLKGDNLRHLMRISAFDMTVKELIAFHMPTLVLNWKRQKERRFTQEREDVPLIL